MLGYASISYQFLIFAIADPLLELKQKTDSPCLPKLRLLFYAIADPFSALTNAVDLSCLLICDSEALLQADRTQTISTDLLGVSIMGFWEAWIVTRA
jgi:hypothetical protein